jgi:hypothetical protein
MKVVISESQKNKILKNIVSDLNKKFHNRYEVCKFEIIPDEDFDINPTIKLKIDKKWVNSKMTKSGFTGKDELKSLIKNAIDFIQDKYDVYLTILPYSDKC